MKRAAASDLNKDEMDEPTARAKRANRRHLTRLQRNAAAANSSEMPLHDAEAIPQSAPSQSTPVALPSSQTARPQGDVVQGKVAEGAPAHRTGLLDLPPELRVYIYDFLNQRAGVCNLRKDLPSAISQSCRLLRNESFGMAVAGRDWSVTFASSDVRAQNKRPETKWPSKSSFVNGHGSLRDGSSRSICRLEEDAVPELLQRYDEGGKVSASSVTFNVPDLPHYNDDSRSPRMLYKWTIEKVRQFIVPKRPRSFNFSHNDSMHMRVESDGRVNVQAPWWVIQPYASSHFTRVTRIAGVVAAKKKVIEIFQRSSRGNGGLTLGEVGEILEAYARAKPGERPSEQMEFLLQDQVRRGNNSRASS